MMLRRMRSRCTVYVDTLTLGWRCLDFAYLIMLLTSEDVDVRESDDW